MTNDLRTAAQAVIDACGPQGIGVPWETYQAINALRAVLAQPVEALSDVALNYLNPHQHATAARSVWADGFRACERSFMGPQPAATPAAPARSVPTAVLDAMADAHRWDTTEGRRDLIRAAMRYQQQTATPFPQASTEVQGEAVAYDDEYCQELAARGWQAVVCGVCGCDGARAFPRPASPASASTASRVEGWQALSCKALTDDDIEAIASSVRPITETGEPSWEHAIARAIERAHGIHQAAEGAEGGKV